MLAGIDLTSEVENLLPYEITTSGDFATAGE